MTRSLICIAILSVPLNAVGQEAGQSFGALAVGDNHGYGVTVDYPTQSDADTAALNECRSRDEGCEILERFEGGICFAVSSTEDADLFDWAIRAELQEASTDAQRYCVGRGGRGCRITDTGCSAPDTRQDSRCEGPYSNGERHGTHTCHMPHGEVCEIPWVYGERYGTVVCRADGYTIERPYVNGRKHGTQVARFANGNVVETPFAEGRLDGSAIMRRPDGSVISAASGLFARDNPYRFARAARAGGDEALQKILAETGSHINQPSLFPRNMGQGALYFAIEQDRPTADDDRDVQRTIEVLIEAGADVQFVNVTDWTNSTYYDTPLHQAASRNSTAAAIPLIAAGADVNALNLYGESPLHHAASGNSAAVAIRLIGAGADVNALDRYGHSPLHGAVGLDRDAAAIPLIDAGADVNALDVDGESPLHIAAWLNNTAVAIPLIAADADVDALDVDGESPLHIAAWLNHTALVILLTAAGADINALNNDEKSPLDKAIDGCVLREIDLPRLSGYPSNADPETAALIAMEGGRLNAPLSFGDILGLIGERLGPRPFLGGHKREAQVPQAMDRCYPPGIEWEKP